MVGLKGRADPKPSGQDPVYPRIILYFVNLPRRTIVTLDIPIQDG